MLDSWPLSIKLAPGRRLKHLTLSLVPRKLREVHGRSLLHGQTTSRVKVIVVYFIYVCFAIKKKKRKLLRCFSLLYFPGTQSGLKFRGKTKQEFSKKGIRLLILLFDVFRRYNYSLLRNFVELRYYDCSNFSRFRGSQDLSIQITWHSGEKHF